MASILGAVSFELPASVEMVDISCCVTGSYVARPACVSLEDFPGNECSPDQHLGQTARTSQSLPDLTAFSLWRQSVVQQRRINTIAAC